MGEEKDFTTVWLTLGQRTLRYETYVMPAPEENRQAVMELLLRRNDTLVGAHFSIGDEDAIYLRGELPDVAVDDDELDRVLGTLYTTVEANFRPLAARWRSPAAFAPCRRRARRDVFAIRSRPIDALMSGVRAASRGSRKLQPARTHIADVSRLAVGRWRTTW